ncbi:sugar transferase [Fusobacterium perfoetens]|nr:sugar transferase [Fusobacterium perfoetens]MCF2613306.1 sugar transferase [Fusobacterium perfoetens]
MILKDWEQLPEELQLDEVRPYYEILKKKKLSLILKRIFDIVVSLIMLIILLPVFIFLGIAIKIDSKGPVFFRQERITQYGKTFKIFKFRTMVNNAEKLGTQVTVGNDARITKVGKFIRDCRLDEIAQLLNILTGDMTFVGTRPEVKKYVNYYTKEMMATLLLPAGVTSLASIYYKDEAKLLDKSNNPDKTYVEEVLPGKMKYNLQSIREFNFFEDIKTMLKTVVAVIK